MKCSRIATILGLIALVSCSQTQAQEYRWIHQDSIPNCFYLDVACYDGNNCVAIANNGGLKMIVRRTTDGGTTWNQIYLDSGYVIDNTHYNNPFWLRRVAQPSPEHILVACDSGRILHTEDAGAHWSIVQTSTGEMLNCISMADTLNGLAGGNAAGLFTTHDGGTTWQFMPRPDSLYRKGILDLVCFTPSIYLVLTNSQDIIRTDDGGTHWRFNRGPAGSLRIAFASQTVGWAAGRILTGTGAQARDLIYVTHDSGATWQAQVDSLIPAAFGLRDVAFTDSLNGIATGQVGKVLRTTDGGRTWRQEQVHLDAQLIAVIYPTPTTALIVSNEGNILKQERVANAVDDRLHADAAHLQVIPNPVDGTGTIRYSLTEPGPARITLCDMLGRERTILDGQNAEAGDHEILVPQELPAGIYLVRLITGSQATSVRCVVQR
ncbi:MAG TPA: YCF48-related protein [Candidatus Kapabacteria bacterium]|nr:YCF48-related protein [Candidatus Kapabacteria bacterium]